MNSCISRGSALQKRWKKSWTRKECSRFDRRSFYSPQCSFVELLAKENEAARLFVSSTVTTSASDRQVPQRLVLQSPPPQVVPCFAAATARQNEASLTFPNGFNPFWTSFHFCAKNELLLYLDELHRIDLQLTTLSRPINE